MDFLQMNTNEANQRHSRDGQPVRLSALHAGDHGYLEDAGCCEDCDLLSALGMTDQCRFRVCKAGVPCIVQIGGTRIGLSPDVAERIMVVPNE